MPYQFKWATGQNGLFREGGDVSISGHGKFELVRGALKGSYPGWQLLVQVSKMRWDGRSRTT